MQSPSHNQTSSYARYRLLSSIGGKLADALGVVIAIKTLAPGDYGVIGTAVGVMAVLGFVSLAPEDILWRDLPKLRDRLAEHLAAYLWFWLVKLAVVAAVAAGYCLLYGRVHHSGTVAALVFGIVCALQLLSSSALVEIPLFAGLQQQRGATFVVGVRGLWLALLVPNFWLHSLPYYLGALTVYAGVTTAISFWLLHRKFGVNLSLRARNAWPLVRAAIVEFSAWLHLVGRARVFLGRGDLAILGALGVTLTALGEYTVAINLVGFALLLPGVLENVAAVTFAHAPATRRQQLWRLSVIAGLLAVGQFGAGALFGRPVLRLLHVANAETVFGIFLTLLAGTAVLTLASPALAYAMCFRRMRTVCARVWLPAALVFAVAVWFTARRWGLPAAAVVHAVLSGAAGVAMLVEVWLGHDEVTVVAPETAAAESMFQE